jgi:hypothetical protein
MTKKNHGRKNTKAKGNPNQRRDARSVTVIARKGSMTDVAVWAIVGLATLIGIIVGVIYADHKVPAIWLFFCCSVLYSFGGCLFWQQKVAGSDGGPKETDLRMKIGSLFFTPVGRIPVLYVRYSFGKGDALWPVDLAMGVTLTNIRNVPVTVATLAVEMRERRKKWVKLRSMAIRGQRVFWIGDKGLSEAIPVEPDSEMDAVLSNGPLAPNRPARGWMFFTWPPDVPLGTGDSIEWRFTATDTEGNRYSGQIMQHDDPDFSGRGLNLQPSAMDFSAQHEDISALPVRVPPFR